MSSHYTQNKKKSYLKKFEQKTENYAIGAWINNNYSALKISDSFTRFLKISGKTSHNHLSKFKRIPICLRSSKNNTLKVVILNPKNYRVICP